MKNLNEIETKENETVKHGVGAFGKACAWLIGGCLCLHQYLKHLSDLSEDSGKTKVYEEWKDDIRSSEKEQ